MLSCDILKCLGSGSIIIQTLNDGLMMSPRPSSIARARSGWSQYAGLTPKTSDRVRLPYLLVPQSAAGALKPGLTLHQTAVSGMPPSLAQDLEVHLDWEAPPHRATGEQKSSSSSLCSYGARG